MNLRNTLSCMTLAAIAGSAAAGPIYINEIVSDPDGGDGAWEYIELFGCPGESLTGYVVLVMNDDGSTAEIDEAFHFPTTGSLYSLDEDGYFVIWNTEYDEESEGDAGSPSDHALESDIYSVLPDTITNNDADIDNSTDRHEASFVELRTAGDYAGKIANDGSITIILANNVSNYGIIEKDDSIPTTYPFTMIDEVAWSDGGSEYTVEEANEFDYTPGFNPDMLVRCGNTSANIVDTTLDLDPTSGTEPYRDAYIEWFGAEVDSNPTANNEGDVFYSKNSEDSYGAGAYTAGPPSSFTPMEDVDDVTATPGFANHYFDSDSKQISVTCRLAGDMNKDGSVNFADIEHVLNNGGSYADLLKVMDSMGR
ncbi:MAG: hypothetical protein ACF8LL_11610 [Phycisphaerales bacterium]